MTERNKALFEFLYKYITDDRKQRFNEVLDNRTKHICILLEDIFQSHNASAVLRSCDLTGVHEVNIIENRYVYDINPDIVVGSSKWLDIKKYNVDDFNTPEAYDELHRRGYRIVATCPNIDAYTPDTLPLDRPIALAFGTEKTGLTDYAIEHADMCVRIPMYGFTESFNISVSAALLMYQLTQRLHGSSIGWHLSEDERKEILLDWTRKTIQRVSTYERKFFELHPEFRD